MKIFPFFLLLFLYSCEFLKSPQAIAVEEQILEEAIEFIAEEIVAHETQKD
jgi:hypothetical protein